MNTVWKRVGFWVAGWAFLAAAGALPATGQQTGRRPLLGPTDEVYQARDSCDPDPADGALDPPYQLWQRVHDLDIKPEDRTIPRPVIWRNVPNPGLSSHDRIDGLYFYERREILLAPTTAVPADRREQSPEGIPCRYLVSRGTENARGIFRTAAREGRIAAVKVGSILNVAVVEPPVLSRELRRRYVLVDIDGSCVQTELGIDENRPRVGYFFTTDANGESTVEPVKWCEPSDGGDPTSPSNRGDLPPLKGEVLPMLAGRPDPRPSARYSRLGELDELQDLFNALTRGHELPEVQELAFQCREGRLDFLIRIERELRGRLPEAFKVLFAQMIDTPHKCLQPEEITWSVDPGRDPIRQSVSASQELSAETRFSELEKYPWARTPDKAPTAKTSDEDIAKLYRVLTARRFDAPKLEEWKSELSEEDGRVHMRLSISTRGGDPVSATVLLKLLCAHLAATENRCSEVEVLTCVAPTLEWSRRVEFSRRQGCSASDILWKTPKRPGDGP